MFRFTIRDLLLLTVIVAMGLGWAIRERQVYHELGEVRKWEKGAKALAGVFEDQGRIVRWHEDSVVVLNPADVFDFVSSPYDPKP